MGHHSSYFDGNIKEIVKQFEKSGLTVREFCKQTGIPQRTFYRWNAAANPRRKPMRINGTELAGRRTLKVSAETWRLLRAIADLEGKKVEDVVGSLAIARGSEMLGSRK